MATRKTSKVPHRRVKIGLLAGESARESERERERDQTKSGFYFLLSSVSFSELSFFSVFCRAAIRKTHSLTSGSRQINLISVRARSLVHGVG